MKNKKISKSKTIITIIAVIAVTVLIFTTSVNVDMGETEIKIGALFAGSATIEYKNITAVTYEENFDEGTRTFGIGSPRVAAGNFKNKELGSYKLYKWASCDDVIIIKADGKAYVFNGKSQEATKKVYEEFQKKL